MKFSISRCSEGNGADVYLVILRGGVILKTSLLVTDAKNIFFIVYKRFSVFNMKKRERKLKLVILGKISLSDDRKSNLSAG